MNISAVRHKGSAAVAGHLAILLVVSLLILVSMVRQLHHNRSTESLWLSQQSLTNLRAEVLKLNGVLLDDSIGQKLSQPVMLSAITLQLNNIRSQRMHLFRSIGPGSNQETKDPRKFESDYFSELNSYLKTVEDYVNTPEGERSAATLSSIRSRGMAFIRKTNEWIEQNQSVAVEQVSQSSSEPFYFAGGAIVLLVLESVLLFLPLVQRLQHALSSVASSALEAEARSKELETAKEELQESNAALSDHQRQLQQMIDEQRTSLELLRLSSKRFQDLFHGLPIACFSVDPELNIFEWNEESSRLTGFEAFCTFEQSVFEVLVPEERQQEWQEAYDQAIAGTPVRNLRTVTRTSMGEIRPVIVHIFPIRGANDAISGAITALISTDEVEIHLAQAA